MRLSSRRTDGYSARLIFICCCISCSSYTEGGSQPPSFINPLQTAGRRYNNGMYLEMLQQMYGAALEKQAMEKQALNPMQLVQMGRRFAAKNKMGRFNQLIAKRNNAITNSNAFATRRQKFEDLLDDANAEQKWLNHKNGPVYSQFRSAMRRTPDPVTSQEVLQWYKNDPAALKGAFNFQAPMGTVSPGELADWSDTLYKMGL